MAAASTSPGAGAVLEARGLTKRAPGGRPILADISFRLAQGESLAVVGPSGCGKTTLLYLLCGLIRPDGGQVLLAGREVDHCSPDIAIILQDFGLLPWKTVLGNVTLGLKVAGVGREERRSRASQELLRLGLGGREQDFPNCLSGGEQQRVAIARALVCAPQVLLLDEPFSSLDALTREKLQDTLLAVWRERAMPFVLVTHSVAEAVRLGRRIMVLAGQPARVVRVFDNPAWGQGAARDSRAAFDLAREVRGAMEAYL